MQHDMTQALPLTPTVFALIAVSVLLVSALVIGFILNRVLHYRTIKFRNNRGEMIFALLESLPLPLLLLLALYTAIQVVTLPRPLERLGTKLIVALVILVLFYFPAKVMILFLGRLRQRDPRFERVAQPATFFVHVLFALLAVVIILENLGISLTAVWTTLGVGSVAVALAAQETLSNLFAGVSLLVDRPIGPLDVIRLDSGLDGTVVQIGWRSTTLRTLTNNLVVVPNSMLAKSVITNYSLPEPRIALNIPVGVAYGTDPRRVEEVLVELARKAARDGLEGLLPDPPTARLIPGFGSSTLDFTLTVQVRQFADQYPVQSELRKRILERFQQAGIEMPFPTRTILVDKSVLDSLKASGEKS
jgi:small-conductance mechanosensitive channel